MDLVSLWCLGPQNTHTDALLLSCSPTSSFGLTMISSPGHWLQDKIHLKDISTGRSCCPGQRVPCPWEIGWLFNLFSRDEQQWQSKPRNGSTEIIQHLFCHPKAGAKLPPEELTLMEVWETVGNPLFIFIPWDSIAVTAGWRHFYLYILTSFQFSENINLARQRLGNQKNWFQWITLCCLKRIAPFFFWIYFLMSIFL